MLDEILLSELEVEKMNTPTGKDAGVLASVIFTLSGARGGADKTREVVDAEEPKANRAKVAAVVEEAKGELH